MVKGGWIFFFGEANNCPCSGGAGGGRARGPVPAQPVRPEHLPAGVAVGPVRLPVPAGDAGQPAQLPARVHLQL